MLLFVLHKLPKPAYGVFISQLMRKSRANTWGGSSLHITYFAGLCQYDSSRAPGLTSGLQGSVNVHRGALLLVP